jgi:plastocyanin
MAGLGLFGSAASATIHEVVQKGQAFEPQVVVIQPGDTVHWSWTIGIHTVTSGSNCTPDGLFNAPLDTAHRNFSFTFDSAGTYDYFCTPHCAMGMTGTVQVEGAASVPEAGEVARVTASPNPFGSRTELSFATQEAGPARVEIFDASGRLASVIHDGWIDAGAQRMEWDGLRSDGGSAPAGIYYARILTQGQVEMLHLVKID